jgi:hypothetical protein
LENKTSLNILSDNYAKFYNPCEHLDVDEDIVLFRGRVFFIQYIPKKHKCFGIKIYKHDMTGYTYNMMSIYFRKGRKNATHDDRKTCDM